jgi:tetratricopeptide (TPR) repeat protein
MWIHFGLLGAALYTTFIAWILRKFWHSKDISKFTSLALISLVISNFFSFSLLIHGTFASFFIALLTDKKPSPPANKHLRSGLIVFTLIASIISLHTFTTSICLYKASQKTNLEQVDSIYCQSPFYASPAFAGFELYFDVKNFEAEKFNKRSQAITNHNLQSQLDEAKLHSIKGNFSEAENIYLSLIKDGINYPYIFLNLGDLLYHQEQYQRAIQHYKQGLELLPKLELGSEEERIFWKTNQALIPHLLRIKEITDK